MPAKAATKKPTRKPASKPAASGSSSKAAQLEAIVLHLANGRTSAAFDAAQEYVGAPVGTPARDV